MKRNLKSILKYLIFILITIFLTIIVFKLLKQLNQHNSNDDIHLETFIASKQLYSNQTAKIDWHDWEFINMEKLRTGKIIFCIFEYLYL